MDPAIGHPSERFPQAGPPVLEEPAAPARGTGGVGPFDPKGAPALRLLGLLQNPAAARSVVLVLVALLRAPAPVTALALALALAVGMRLPVGARVMGLGLGPTPVEDLRLSRPLVQAPLFSLATGLVRSAVARIPSLASAGSGPRKSLPLARALAPRGGPVGVVLGQEALDVGLLGDVSRRRVTVAGRVADARLKLTVRPDGRAFEGPGVYGLPAAKRASVPRDRRPCLAARRAKTHAPEQARDRLQDARPGHAGDASGRDLSAQATD